MDHKSIDFSVDIFLILSMIFAISFSSLAGFEVFAETLKLVPNLDFGWNINVFFQDLRENIAEKINQNWGNEIRLESAQTAQVKLEELLSEGKPVPQELFERVQEKIDQIRPSVQSIQQDVWDTFKIITETNNIRKILTDIQSNQYTPEELQQRINSFESVQKYCSQPPNVTELLSLRETKISATRFDTERDMRIAYNRLQEICPILQDYDAESAYELLNRN